MKKNLHFLRLSIALLTMCCTIPVHAKVVPYVAPLQSFGGSTVDLSTFLPGQADYTLEVQGSVGTLISVPGGAYTYTPTINGVVRFTQKAGKVYVYEGNVYMTTLTPIQATTYPAITDADAATNANNMLQNASFETLGALVTGTAATTTAKHAFGTPWVSNYVINATTNSIRVGMSTLAVNGSYVCVWRGSANANYFAQPLSTPIKPNTSYKIIVRQVAGSNAYANFNVGLGSTADGMEFGSTALTLGNTKDGTWSTQLRTPLNVTGTPYFTFKNTAVNTSSSGTDPITQMDYIALVEGVDVPGILGVTSASFLTGTAYAPENVAVDFSAGDYYDITNYIVNPTIEGASNTVAPLGWTVDKGTGNTFTATGQHYSLVTTNRYLDSWNGTAGSMLFTAQQTLTGLPNGTYKLSVAARTSGTGSYLLAKSAGKIYRTELINNGSVGGTLGNGFSTIIVEAAVLDNTLTIGLSTSAAFTGGSVWAGTWFSADDFTLSFLGEQKVLTVSQSSFLFDDKNTSKTFNVSGAFLTEGVTISAPEGITLSKTTMTASEAQDGMDITAQFTGAATLKNGLISIAAGSLSKTISFNALLGDATCFTPIYTDRANLITDPYCNDRSKFGGWGNVANSEVKSFCGERSLKAFGGSLDVSISAGTAIASNKTYRVKAKIFAPVGHTAKFGLFGIGNTSDVDVYSSTTNDAWETADFTFKTATVGTGGVFFQRTSGADSVFIDNYEMYEVAEPTVRVKYIDVDNVSTSIKDDRLYTATWGTSLANYLTIGKIYSALTTDKDVVTFGGYNFNYDNTSVENVTLAEGENVIILKFKKDLSTGNANLGNSVMTVYPTITNGNVYVSLFGKTGTIRLLDVTGRIVTTKVASSSREVLSLPSTGVFIVEVNSGDVIRTFKVIKVK